MKKTILHIIDNLARGGAETMIVKVTNGLNQYHNIVVTLYPVNEFETELKSATLICLHLGSPLYIPKAACKLRKIINENKVDLVHSHLFWSTVVARLGVPKSVPLITTIHTFVKSSIEYQPLRMRLIEKFTYLYRKSIIVAVAKGALDEYFDFIKVKPYKSYTLYTFVDTAGFKEAEKNVKKKKGDVFKIVSVGNLKIQKNQLFLMEAFKALKGKPISLDIFGDGPLQHSLQQLIHENNVNVTLKGKVSTIQEVLKDYDMFVMSSLYEGFALSVLEAMAVGLPMMLSNIPSFKEQCEDTAIYFSLNNSNDFVEKLLAIKDDSNALFAIGQAGKNRATSLFTLTQHLLQLTAIYNNALKLY